MKVFIRKKSVRKNPNAFSTFEKVVTGWEASFKFCKSYKLPEWLKEDDNIITKEWETSEFLGKRETIITYIIVAPETLDRIVKEKIEGVFEIVQNFNYATITHFPSPEYFFEYQNTFVECNNCHKKTRLNDIEETSLDLEETIETVCNHCQHYGTFDIEYETIQEFFERTKEKING